MSDTARVHVVYSGDVQGVGFRRRALDVALRFRVTGTVRNVPDGTVELVAEGARAEVEAFLAAVRERLGAHIDDESAVWSAATGAHAEFRVIR